MAKLTFRAPRRCWFKTENGWASRAWTPEDITEAGKAGAWFAGAAYHDYA